jgi:Sortase domain
VTGLASSGGRLAIVLIAGALLTGSATEVHDMVASAVASTATTNAAPPPERRALADLGTKRAVVRDRALRIPAPLTGPGLSLRAGPVPVPIRLRIPSIGVDLAVIGVGMTPNNVMDAPEGPPDDPVWQEAFWYRGSAVPGGHSTTLFAGHIDDPLGRPGSFANIGRLRRGDLIVVHDNRTGLDVRFAVTGSTSYPLAATSSRAVLTRMYGSGPVAGKGPQRSGDGRAHLTLVTCAGVFQSSMGTHDHRLVVFATRVS